MSTTFVRGEDPLRADKLNTAFSERVSRTGDTMQGLLTLARDPVNAFDAATKQYVDRFTSMGVPSGAYIGASPPGNTLAPLWWDNVSGQLYIQYNDGSSTQWVSTSSIPTTQFPLSGGTLAGPLLWTATGTTASRSAQDRSAEWVNVKDSGAPLNGTAFDGNAINAALARIRANQAINFPSGGTSYAGISTTPATPVHWILDGVTLGTSSTPVQQFQRTNLGDLVENYYNGQKIYWKTSANVDSPGMLRLDYRLDQAGGSVGVISIPISVNARDNAGAVTSMWGLNVNMDSYSQQSTSGLGSNWPQNVGANLTIKKHGAAWAAGFHITALDDQNLPSSTAGSLLGAEIGYHVNAADDAFSGSTFGNAGTRSIMHLAYSVQTGTTASELAAGIQFTGDAYAVAKSVIGVGIGCLTYQVLDTRGAVAPSGYGSPVAGLRMLHDQIVDFNGGAALNSAAGNYLQYRTATQRLYYVVAGVDQWSIDASGNVRARGTVTGSTTP